MYGFWRTTLGAGQVGGFTAGGLGGYFVTVQVLQMAVIPAIFVTWELWDDINRGNLTVWLTRPLHYQLYILAQKLSEFLVRMGAGVLL